MMTTTATSYPPYVPTLGYAEQCSPPPGLVSGAHVSCFALKMANKGRAQAMVDHFLNDPVSGAVRYKVLGELVFVTFTYADSLTSLSEEVGWQPDYETAFWLPLVATGPAGMSDRLVFWMPYIAISVPEGMVTGREIWGFPKQVGEIDRPQPNADPQTYESRALVYDPLARTTKGRIEPLVTITGPLGAREPVWSDLESMMRGLHDLWAGGGPGLGPGGDIELTIDTLAHLLMGEVELVNLKQFRDAMDPTRACYQALIEGPCTIRKLHGAGLLPEGFTARIPDWASHRIGYHLGLPMTETLPVEYGLWVSMDFSAEAGREVWKASAGSEPPAQPAPGCLNLLRFLRK
jgi:hypothetical protein